jgi:hypothetical protein
MGYLTAPERAPSEVQLGQQQTEAGWAAAAALVVVVAAAAGCDVDVQDFFQSPFWALMLLSAVWR